MSTSIVLHKELMESDTLATFKDTLEGVQIFISCLSLLIVRIGKPVFLSSLYIPEYIL